MTAVDRQRMAMTLTFLAGALVTACTTALLVFTSQAWPLPLVCAVHTPVLAVMAGRKAAAAGQRKTTVDRRTPAQMRRVDPAPVTT